jgi:hypothetical protein
MDIRLLDAILSIADLFRNLLPNKDCFGLLCEDSLLTDLTHHFLQT